MFDELMQNIYNDIVSPEIDEALKECANIVYGNLKHKTHYTEYDIQMLQQIALLGTNVLWVLVSAGDKANITKNKIGIKPIECVQSEKWISAYIYITSTMSYLIGYYVANIQADYSYLNDNDVASDLAHDNIKVNGIDASLYRSLINISPEIENKFKFMNEEFESFNKSHPLLTDVIHFRLPTKEVISNIKGDNPQ